MNLDIFLLIFFIIVFIIIRSIHFSSYLNFSSDQALFSIRSYQIYTDRELTLIGPPTSINIDGRQIFQGSVIYYFLLIFLLLGQFDPVVSSYFFMLFCALMIIPLFFGVKFLINNRAAYFLTIIYTLLPYYIDYTRFFWNPNFQFALTPLLIFIMGCYRKKPYRYLLFLTGILSGALLQFHYQFILVIIAQSLFYIRLTKRHFNVFVLFFGYIVGFFPIILFEFRNSFYNLNTLILYYNKNSSYSLPEISDVGHYFLTLSLLLFLIFTYFIRNLVSAGKLIFLFIFLSAISLLIYIPLPTSGFRMSDNWNFTNEERVFKIIISQNLSRYNVTNLIYDTKANVQKYLILSSGINFNPEDYKNNENLFVISPNNKDILSDQAYEVISLKPFAITKRWQINKYYSLFLLQRKYEL